MKEELRLVRDSVAAWVAAGGGVRGIRNGSEMAALGWTGALLPERLGGSALGFRGMGAIVEELGRFLVPSTLVGSAVACACALAWSGQHEEWLSRLAEGSATAALAVDEAAHHAPARIAMRAERTATGFVLSGTKQFVSDGMAADLFVVAARTDGVRLFALPASADGLARHPQTLIDGRDYATLAFDHVVVPETALLSVTLDPVLDAARGALAAEMLGLARQALETTLDYLRMRVQFGRPIGAFQALQHRAAFLFTRLVLTRGLVEDALDALDANPATTAARVSAAKAAAGGLVNLATREMMQMHGGIAMTESYDCGLYLKRARVLEASLGSTAYHRDRFAALHGF